MGRQNQQLPGKQGVFNLFAHYGHLGELLDNTCRNRDLFGQRCGLSISISSDSPGGSRAATAENLSIRDINSEVSLNPGEWLGGPWAMWRALGPGSPPDRLHLIGRDTGESWESVWCSSCGSRLGWADRKLQLSPILSMLATPFCVYKLPA